MLFDSILLLLKAKARAAVGQQVGLFGAPAPAPAAAPAPRPAPPPPAPEPIDRRPELRASAREHSDRLTRTINQAARTSLTAHNAVMDAQEAHKPPTMATFSISRLLEPQVQEMHDRMKAAADAAEQTLAQHVGGEQVVHVKQHTRQTAHGVQVVAAHDEKRKVGKPAPPPNPRTQAGRDEIASRTAYHKRVMAGRIGTDGVLGLLPKDGEEGAHIHPGGYVGVQHLVDELARRHEVEATPEAMAGLRGHVEDVLAAAHRGGKVERQNRASTEDVVRHSHTSAERQPWERANIAMANYHGHVPHTEAERVKMRHDLRDATKHLDAVRHLMTPELAQHYEAEIAALRGRTVTPHSLTERYLQQGPQTGAPYLLDAAADAELGIPSAYDIVMQHGAVNAAAVEWVRHRLGKRSANHLVGKATAQAYSIIAAKLEQAMKAAQPRAKIPEAPASDDAIEARRGLEDYINTVANKRLGKAKVDELLAIHGAETSPLGVEITRVVDLKRRLPLPRTPADAVFAARRGAQNRIAGKDMYGGGDPGQAVRALRARGFRAHLEHEGEYHTPIIVTDAPEHVPAHEWAALDAGAIGRGPRRDPDSVTAHLATHGLPEHAPDWGGKATAHLSEYDQRSHPESLLSPFGVIEHPRMNAGPARYSFASDKSARAALPWHEAAAVRERERHDALEAQPNLGRLELGRKFDARRRAEEHEGIAAAARSHLRLPAVATPGR